MRGSTIEWCKDHWIVTIERYKAMTKCGRVVLKQQAERKRRNEMASVIQSLTQFVPSASTTVCFLFEIFLMLSVSDK